MFSGPMAELEQKNPSPKQYRWPFVVGAFVILWLVLTVVWMFWGVEQTRKEREIRNQHDEFGNPITQTNQNHETQ